MKSKLKFALAVALALVLPTIAYTGVKTVRYSFLVKRLLIKQAGMRAQVAIAAAKEKGYYFYGATLQQIDKHECIDGSCEPTFNNPETIAVDYKFTNVAVLKQGLDEVRQIRGNGVLASVVPKLKKYWALDALGQTEDNTRASALDPTKDCMVSFGGYPTLGTKLGKETVTVQGRGFESVKVQHGKDETTWYALEVGCLPIKATMRFRSKKETIATKETTSIILGIPDPKFFTIDSDYTDMLPSDLLIQLVPVKNDTITQQARKSSKQLDDLWLSGKRHKF